MGGIVFAALSAAYAFQMIASKRLPMIEIGALGAIWASLLIYYFGRQLMKGPAGITPLGTDKA